ncbi:PTS lactose transporter subunit IIB (plasmid) [Exiguobacterium sp. N4-1P]|uniref:PTS sugar transporter subunit IIB n=1 Tax=unclassified Exiguobacterium TaxID=2644629 RepID=UPI000B595045|nr:MULTISPECIES: PTS sugar transporter subunit IIB [unclassified Exiguobacterium]ASI35284.1 PTS lactose transporter subunit IIB [Exiguobacterium sp. N4-1P]ASI37297.1 PTS lactose transporter subunit IIB [Exiguobacterium sp. N4-1P]
MKKILVVCGNGLGSSFIMELNVKKALDQMGKEADVSHTDLSTARTEQADIYLGAKDIIGALDDGNREIVALENVMNIEDIKEQLSTKL